MVIQLFVYFFKLTLIDFGFTASVLGRVNVNTPFSNVASALSAFTPLGNVTQREKEP